jgi:hypothetical protein
MSEGSVFPARIPQSIIDNIEMAETYFTPQKLFMEYEMVQYNLTDEGKNATRTDKTKHRAFFEGTL